MLLIQDGKLIENAKRNKNLFLIDLVMIGKIIQVKKIANITTTTGQERQTHLVSCSKKVRVWQRKFGDSSNAIITYASKLLIKMNDFNFNHNKEEIYSNFEISELEKFTINNANLSSK